MANGTTTAEVERPVNGFSERVPADDFVIFVGEKPKSSAPSMTLAKALEALGVGVRFVRPDLATRREWVAMLRHARAILLLTYGEIEPYLLGQLATAAAMNVPVVRWWVGSDVLYALTQAEIREHALRANRIVSANVAVAPHLVDELATIGIAAQFIPSVLDPGLVPSSVAPWGTGVRPILIYMPSVRKEFYGIDMMESAIASNPDLEFIVVADQTHSLATHPNVESLGWVPDMREQYDRSGCVLRVTQHDGLPRMLLEALLRGMYAIYSWPLAGCWEARTPDEIAGALARYRQMRDRNVHGREAVLALLRARPDQQMSAVLSSATMPVGRRVDALGLALRTKLFPAQFR